MAHLNSNFRTHKSTFVFLLINFLFLLFGATTTSAKTINALTAQDLRIALGQESTSDPSKVAVPGDTIILTAGASYEGPFILPNLSNPNNLLITIQSSQLSLLPDGQRVKPSDYSYMPKVISPGLGAAALKTAPRASHYKILGIEFTFPDADNLTVDSVVVYNLILLGDPDYTSEADLPNDLTLDRCYVHGQPTRPSQRGIGLHTKETWITNSYISDIHWDQGEAQGISGYNGKGPYHIINNYVEASGQNIFFGGRPPNIQGVMADGVEVRRNYLYKPLSWHPSPTGYCSGSLWKIKSLFELKSAKNVIVDGNIMENNWGCEGYGAINLTVRNDSPGGQNKNSWATIQNVTISNNIIRHVNFGINILGLDDYGQPSVQGHGLIISNNLFEDISHTLGDNSSARWIRINSMNDVMLSHNTVFDAYGIVAISGQANGAQLSGFVMKDNIATRGGYGISGFVPVNNGPFSEGQSVIETYFVNPPLPPIDHNVIIGGNSSLYHPGYDTSNFWPQTMAEVGFLDYSSSNPNYRLATGTPYKNAASDGKDIGADIGAIEAATGYSAHNTAVPAAPTQLSVSLTAGNVTKLMWADNSNNETGFKIERKYLTGTSWALYTTIGPNISKLGISDSDASMYYYRIRATNDSPEGVKDSAPSNEAWCGCWDINNLGFNIKVNFQTETTITPAGYVADAGMVYADRGNGYSYGWDVANVVPRERNSPNSPDKRYDTLCHMQLYGDYRWEIAVPNGTYTVRIVAGDPDYNDGVYKINAEGTLMVNGTPTGTNHWIEGTQTVTVSDGRLTVTNAAGSTNNKIDFIEISAVSPPTPNFVNDTFTGASGTLLSAHTGETGAMWTKHSSYPGNSYISSANRMSGGGDSLYYASGVPATADYDVQADLVSMQQAASTTGVAGRVSTTGDSSYRVIFSVPSGKYHLQVVNAGVVTQLQEIGPWQWGGNFTDGSTHTIKLQMRGSSIKVFIDGVERMSATDSTVTAAGRVGIYTRSYSMTDTWGIHIDNFTATNAP